MPAVTELLDAIDRGDSQASDALLPLVYAELRREAGRMMAAEKPGQTLGPTALVHEVYLRLIGPSDAPNRWRDHRHFFLVAAESMRRILIEQARGKKRLKRGGGALRERLELDQLPAGAEVEVDHETLDHALAKLAAGDPGKAELVKLRFYAGLSLEEAAEVLGLSRATAYRRWAYTKAWLFGELRSLETEAGE